MNQKAKPKQPKVVGIVMGSDSDYKFMCDAAEALRELNISYDVSIVSAHRTPTDMMEYATSSIVQGRRIIIAGAGGAAHLPGMLAALTDLPVIGVPIPHGPLQGQDALLSIVQMPRGVPVATVAIGNSYNAGLLAAKILAFGTDDKALQKRLQAYREELAEASRRKKLPKPLTLAATTNKE